jgi:mRNA interferase HigB
MHVISVRTLRRYWERHASAKEPLKAWYDDTRQRSWSSPAELQKDYPNASILPGNRVVFNIKGNQFRLVVRINYHSKTVFVRFIGTHAEYDRIDAAQI